MSPKQAEEFARRYPLVVAQIDDVTSGLSMTAFRDSSGGVSLAIRGSELSLADWLLTNTDIAINGAGYQQIAALYNAWQRLTHRLGETITVYDVDLGNSADPVVARTMVNDLGTASTPLVSPGAAVSVAGHSLGGHLALAFAGLFPLNAREVHAFNAPGFIDSPLNRTFFARLGGQLPVGPMPAGVPTLNVIADAQPGPGQGVSVVAGLHSRPGTPLDIAIENQAPPTDEPVPPFNRNHALGALTDALAVFAVLEGLAPAFSAVAFESLLASAARGTAASLERIVDALEQTLGIDATPLATGNAHRNALYEAIYALRSSNPYKALQGTAALRVTADLDAATLAARAKQDFGYFLAVQSLLPLTIESAGSALIAAHPDLYARWSADRAKRLAGGSDLEFTDAYLADRAAFLVAKNATNSIDLASTIDPASNENWRYVDRPQNLEVTVVGGAAGTPPLSLTRWAMFGGEGADRLRGASLSDRLYGGGGTDRLEGKQADDYMEGGAGVDTYVLNAGDGQDQIRDQGRNFLLRDGKLIAGAFVRDAASGAYRFVGDSGTTLAFNSPATISFGGGDSVTLLDQTEAVSFASGAFGVRLLELPAGPQTTVTFNGDLQPQDQDPGTPGVQVGFDAFGNVIASATPEPDRMDVLYDANFNPTGEPDSNDLIVAGGGADTVRAAEGDDWLVLGAGADEALAGAGADLVETGPGSDVALGGDGNDRLYGDVAVDLLLLEVDGGLASGVRGDWLSGGLGDDVVVTGGDNDVLLGGGGGDLLVAGAGADAIFGDAAGYRGPSWSVERASVFDSFSTLDPLGRFVNRTVEIDGPGGGLIPGIFGFFQDDPFVGDADFVYAGAGDDFVRTHGGDDYVDAGPGNDVVLGDAGADALVGGEGEDWLEGDSFAVTQAGLAGEDFLFGGAGDDVLIGEGGADVLLGGEGADTLAGDGPGLNPFYAGADYLDGGQGNDTLYGGAGNDVLAGGTEDDLLYGEEGDDTYLLALGDGRDTIADSEGSDRLSFNEVGLAAVQGAQQGTTATLTLTYSADDAVTIEAGLTGSIEFFEFEGASLRLAELLDQAVTTPITLSSSAAPAGFGAILLHGGGGADALTLNTDFAAAAGGKGNDTLTLTANEGTFQFKSGDGSDRVLGSSGTKRFRFEEDVAPESVTARRATAADNPLTPRDLVISYGEADENGVQASFLVEDSSRSIDQGYQFANFVFLNHVQLLEQSGLSLDWLGANQGEGVQATKFDDVLDGQGGDDFLEGRAGNDTLAGGAGSDTLRGEAGNDVLAGGFGKDVLQGGAGDDRYVINAGESLAGAADVVDDASGANTIEFGAPFAATNISAEMLQSQFGETFLVLHLSGTEDLYLKRNFGQAITGTTSFRFSDGTVLSEAELLSTAFSAPLEFQAAGANVAITGSRFDDSLTGGAGSDVLDGADGNDALRGAAGSDVLTGGAGNDFLDGGSGDDTVQGGPDSDRYRLGIGMGRDLVVDGAGGETNTLVLDPGITPADFDGRGLGDDLYLHLRNSREGVVLKDYFTSPGSWNLEESNGTTTPVASIVGALSEPPRPANVQAAFDDFRTRAQTYYRSALAQSGYVLGADGKYHQDVSTGSNFFRQRTVSTLDIATVTETSDAASIVRATPVISTQTSTSVATSSEQIQQLVTNGGSFVSYTNGGNLGAARGAGGTPFFVDLNNIIQRGISGIGFSVAEVGIYPPPVHYDPATNTLGFWVFPNGTAAQGQTIPPSGGQSTPIYQTQTVSRTNFEVQNTYTVNIGEVNGGASANAISFGPADTFGWLGFNLVNAGAGDDTVTAESLGKGVTVPQGSPSRAGAPGVLLYGAEGNDSLTGSPNEDVLIGGAGDDVMRGGGGNDTYLVFAGDGNDTIFDEGETEAGIARENSIEMPDGVTLNDLSVSYATTVQSGRYVATGHPGPETSVYAALDVSWGTGSVRIVVPHSDQNAGTGIEALRFSDGSSASFADLVAIGGPAPTFDPHDLDNADPGITWGGGGNDTLQGANISGGLGQDTLTGTPADDRLFGGEKLLETGLPSGGAPELSTLWDEGNLYRGGQGDDELWATAGSDVFEYAPGDGLDTVSDLQHDETFFYGGFISAEEFSRLWQDPAALDPAHRAALFAGQDTLRFGPGIAPSDVRALRERGFQNPDNDSLILALGEGAGGVRFENWFKAEVNQLTRVEFADGTVWDAAAIASRAALAPTLARGTEFDDFLFGGPEDNAFFGLQGNDTYFFGPGSGVDTIEDSGGIDTVEIGAPSSDVSLGLGSLVLRVAVFDELHLANFDPNDALGAHDIELFRFSDGTELSYPQLIARGFDLFGTAADETIPGTNVTDRIDGRGGNDLLLGGLGSDTYAFGPGSGQDTIREASSTVDADVLDVAANPGAVSVTREGGSIVLSLDGTADRVAIEWFADPSARIESVRFADGTAWEAATLEAQIQGQTNQPPSVASPIADQQALEDAPFSFVLPADTFTDPDAGDSLSYSASLADGSPLPAWLSFGAATRAFSGTPAQANAGSIGVRVTATDSGGLSASDTFALAVANVNDAPVVSAPNAQILIGQTVTAGSLFSVTDEDGDPIAQYNFFDPQSGGSFRVNGATQPGGQPFAVSAADLAGTEYVGAAVQSTEWVMARAYDGLVWSAWRTWSIGSAAHATNAAPVVSAADSIVLLNQEASVAGLFSASDADGDPIVQYQFYDSGQTGGRFRVNGTLQPSGQAFTVNAADLAATQYVGAPVQGTEGVMARAYDGLAWSAWRSWSIGSSAHATNAAPVVSAADAVVPLGVAVDASSLFAVSDADGDAIQSYQLKDLGAGGGAFTVGGVAQPSGQAFTVAAADLPNVRYMGGSTQNTEQVMARAYDGLGWSEWQGWNIGSAAHAGNAAPVVAAADAIVGLDEAVDAGTLFSVSDADADPVTQYQFNDTGQAGGSFTVNGVAQPAGQPFTVDAADLGNVRYVGASVQSTEQVKVRANDGLAWSPWAGWNVGSSPHPTNAAPVLAAADAGLLLGESVEVSSLFSASDADGDAVQQYEFQDLGGAGGGFAVNGVAQPGGQVVAVSAADLANVRYLAGSAPGVEWLKARAYDGLAWSDWQGWDMHSIGGMRRGGSGADTLDGDADTPVLEGNGGEDTLNASGQNSLLSGGEGSDVVNGAAGSDLIAGGAGDDAIHTGAGANVIVFNAGDGVDSVYSSAGAANTLSLGGGIGYDDVSLSKEGDDLVVGIGANDRVVLKGWYAGADDVLSLQFVGEATSASQVNSFDFAGIVTAFDAARAANPGLTAWAVTNALTQFHLASSDTEALGGDLAWYYGMIGSFGGLGLTAALDAITASSFGQQAQQLRPLSGLQEGLVRLSA